MEFADPVVAEEERSKETASQPEASKTEETVEKLESEIDKAYTAVEARFHELWTNAAKNASGLQDKYQLDERKNQLLDQLNAARESLVSNNNVVAVKDNLKVVEEQLKKVHLTDVKIDLKSLQTQANTALDSLDSTLEQVEKQAGKYVSSFTSFLSSLVTVEPEDDGAGDEKDVLFGSSNAISSHENYGTSRYDNDLFKLHTSETYYLSEDLDVKSEVESFNADSKTDEISKLLGQFPNTLTKTMNDLVPVKIPYNLFWYRYFKQDEKLRDSEQKRKELLQKKSTSSSNKGDEDEEFTWDDEEEEEEEDVVDVAKEVKDPKSVADEKSDSKASEEDDDWE